MSFYCIFVLFFQIAFIHLDRNIVLSINNYVFTSNSCISVTHDNNSTWSLKIQNVKKEDKGFYKCQLISNPQTFTIGYLNVLGMYYIVVCIF